jgi:hypothetical protein
MNSIAAFLTPLALLLPAAAGQPSGLPGAAAHSPGDPATVAPAGLASPTFAIPRVLEDARRPVENQVRIEQRVIIRIAPSSQAMFTRSLAQLDADADSFEEVRLDSCVPINMIVATHPQESRLLLFMRDRRVLTVALERACNPEDFYAGFYVERQDGQLCERRDELRSRAGATCRITRLHRLVAKD